MSSVWKTPSGAPARRNEILERERALGDVRGVLEEADVAGHQRRRGKADHLPEGKFQGMTASTTPSGSKQIASRASAVAVTISGA